MKEIMHDSDCSVNNEPAYPAGPCDCGALAKAQHQYVKMLGQIFCKTVARHKTYLRSKLIGGYLQSKTNASKVCYLNLYCLLFGKHERRHFLRVCIQALRIEQFYLNRDKEK